MCREDRNAGRGAERTGSSSAGRTASCAARGTSGSSTSRRAARSSMPSSGCGGTRFASTATRSSLPWITDEARLRCGRRGRRDRRARRRLAPARSRRGRARGQRPARGPHPFGAPRRVLAQLRRARVRRPGQRLAPPDRRGRGRDPTGSRQARRRLAQRQGSSRADPVELFPFRLPLRLGDRLALVRAGVRLRLAVRRYAAVARERPGRVGRRAATADARVHGRPLILGVHGPAAAGRGRACSAAR